MRLLFIGDVVGRSGRAVVAERLPGLVAGWKLDLVVVNGENAAGGFGLNAGLHRAVVAERLPGLVAGWKLDLVVVNGENAAGGFGITEVLYEELLDAGADAV